jgi:hypothetical protein
MMDGNIEIRINELIDKSLENSINAEEFAELNQLIASDKECASYYISCMKYRDALYKTQSLLRQSTDPCQSTEQLLLQKLAEYETVAPAVSVEKNTPEMAPEPVGKVPQEKIVRNVKKPFVVLSLVSLAAMVLFIISIQLSPVSPREVATLADSMNASYADGKSDLSTGTRIKTDNGLISQERGIVKWLYDSNVEVVIEAPAKYEFKSAEELHLYSGRVFAKVPPSGRGFTISTKLSKVVDLGTQFGVIADADGDTEVHVFKGQTILTAGGQKKGDFVLNLTAGKAGKISDNGATIKQMQATPNAFIRGIHSETGFVWRGESTIPLTNLLAGRIFEADPAGIEIDPVIGKHVPHENYVSGTERGSRSEYQKMESPFVDGFFVPQGQQPETISSTQLTYQFPKTSGLFHYNLSDQKIAYDGYTASRYPLSLTSVDAEKPLLFLHPNMGVTIDLDKLRQKISGVKIQRFRADCGIAPSAGDALKKAYPDGNIPDAEKPSMDFFVLVDGKVSQTLPNVHLESGILKIDIEIHPTDRFLTLVSTDGNQCFKYDWFVLANPVLEIAAAE